MESTESFDKMYYEKGKRCMTNSKYYRVGAFFRSEDSKQIIIQVHDRKEAEAWVPRVKEMLYPGENTENYRVSIFEFKLQINLSNLNHYRITVERPVKREFKDWEEENIYDNSLAFDGIVEAEDEESAKSKFIEEWFDFYSLGKKPEEYDLYVDEVLVKELIEKEQRMLRQRLISSYARDRYGDMPVREFCKMMRQDESPEKDKMFYEELKNHLHRLRIVEYLEKRLDLERITHAEFNRICDELCAAKVGDEFERINRAATEKYGKEGITD